MKTSPAVALSQSAGEPVQQAKLCGQTNRLHIKTLQGRLSCGLADGFQALAITERVANTICQAFGIIEIREQAVVAVADDFLNRPGSRTDDQTAARHCFDA